MTHQTDPTDDTTGAARTTKPQHNRYAITLAALVAGVQVPVANQVEEQPAAPAHDYSIGFDATGNDGDGQGDARGY